MRLTTRLNRHFVPHLMVLGLTTAACGGNKPATPVDTAPAVAADVALVDTAPAPPPSRTEEAKGFFGKPLDVAGIEGALALADALSQEATPEAKLAAARIRLVVVARDASALAAAPAGSPAESKLGVGGAETQLKLVLGATGDGSLKGPDAERLALAAKAMRFALGNKDDVPDPKALRTLQTGAEPEAVAYRLTLLARYAQARELWEMRGYPAFVAAFGPFACTACGEGPSDETALKAAADASGLACAAPADASFCEGLIAAEAKDSIVKLAPNALAVATLELARRLGGEEDPALGDALKRLVGGLEPVVLPLPVALMGAATLGPAGPQAGLAEVAPTLVVANLTATGVQIGMRAIVASGGALPAMAPGIALSDAPSVTYEALKEVVPDKGSGAVAGVTDRLATVREALATAPAGWPTTTLPGERGAILLAVAPEVGVDALVAVVDGLAAGGPAGVRVLRPGTAGEVLPLHLRVLPAELETALVPAWDKAMIVVVGKDTLDVWAPDGAKEGATAIGPDAAGALPTTVQQGWRKDKLARLRVPLPPTTPAAASPASRLGAEQLRALADAIKVFSNQAKAGRVVHVVAGDGASVADVLRVAQYVQEVGLETAPELARVGEIWPGARCRGATDGDAARAGCAGAVAVAFSKREVPSARGLSDKPGDGKKDSKDSKDSKDPKEPTEPKPEPGPAPSAEFCNQADIKSQMAKKAGSFRFCYERELQLEKDLAGRVVLNFVIGLPGNVKSVRVASSELKNAKVGECIKKEIGKMQFKAPDGGECVVQWPFKFSVN